MNDYACPIGAPRAGHHRPLRGYPPALRVPGGGFALLVLTVGLTLLAAGVARSDYSVRPLVRLGDKVGDLEIKTVSGYFDLGALNNDGQFVFATATTAGGTVLVHYGDGLLTPIAASGQAAPGGTWSQDLHLLSPVSMNQQGNVVFAAAVTVGGSSSVGTFRWDHDARQVSPVALAATPTVNNLTLEDGGFLAPVINNMGDIAFPATIKNSAGKAKSGVFFLGRDGQLLPVALPDQALNSSGKISEAFLPSLNDAGLVACLAHRKGDPNDQFSAFIWEKEQLTLRAGAGMQTPSGGKIAGIVAAAVNNLNRNVLLQTSDSLYLWKDEKLIAVAVPDQDMPGGGQLKGITPQVGMISFANDAGQHAFLAELKGGATGAYLMDAEGKLSLILKRGSTTELGKITSVGGAGSGVGLNNKGQVLLTVHIGGGPDTIVLMTPATL